MISDCRDFHIRVFLKNNEFKRQCCIQGTVFFSYGSQMHKRAISYYIVRTIRTIFRTTDFKTAVKSQKKR